MRRYWSIGWFLCALVVMAAPVVSRAQLLVVTVAPPELPVYEQPPIPDPGYIWTPGYWAYGPDGYYWVPGTWVEPPSAGLLWTPGYWGWQDGRYGFNEGYWGTQVGFYGGVDYGYGYGGDGYEGGYWDNGVFSYNETVNNFGGVRMAHVFNKAVVAHNNASRASFNGGAGGTSARPTSQQQAAAHEKHVPATALQTQHQHTASTNKALLASVNHGNPAVAATSKPGQFEGKGVVPARAGSGAVPATLAKPTTVAPATGPAPAGAAALEKKQPIGTVHPATVTGGPPKTAHTHEKPPTGGSAPKTTALKPTLPPRTAAVAKPAPHPAVAHPVSTPHPVAAAHPVVARPAPHPVAAKPPPPKKPPPH
jgi:hypothetical protein